MTTRHPTDEYILTPTELSNAKRQLTVALKTGDPERVLKACRWAFELFNARGYPDCWHRWSTARDDAALQLQVKGAW